MNHETDRVCPELSLWTLRAKGTSLFLLGAKNAKTCSQSPELLGMQREYAHQGCPGLLVRSRAGPEGGLWPREK